MIFALRPPAVQLPPNFPRNRCRRTSSRHAFCQAAVVGVDFVVSCLRHVDGIIVSVLDDVHPEPRSPSQDRANVWVVYQFAIQQALGIVLPYFQGDLAYNWKFGAIICRDYAVHLPHLANPGSFPAFLYKCTGVTLHWAPVSA